MNVWCMCGVCMDVWMYRCMNVCIRRVNERKVMRRVVNLRCIDNLSGVDIQSRGWMSQVKGIHI